MSDDRFTRVDLLRHGACEGGEIYRGSTDVPLSSNGKEQMHSAFATLTELDAVVTSPLQRCLSFASICSDSLDVPLEVVPGFREMHFGDWEGRELKTVWSEDQARVSAFYSDPENNPPPNGESIPDAQKRAVDAWQSLMKARQGENVLVVCHGGLIRLLMCHLLNMPLSAISQMHVPYASLTRFQIYHREQGDFPVMMSLNAQLANEEFD